MSRNALVKHLIFLDPAECFHTVDDTVDEHFRTPGAWHE